MSLRIIRAVPVVTMLACVAAGFPARAQTYPQAVLNNNPVAYFRLGSTGEGSQVNGFTTTFNGAATLTGAGSGAPLASDPGNVGALLNGTSGTFVSTSLSGQAGFATAGNATLLAWVNLTQLPSVAGRYFYVAGRSEFGNDLDFQFQNDDRLYFYTDSSSATVYTPDTATLLNQYHFLAATLDTAAGVRSIYFDGALVATQNNVAGRSSSAAQFNIGASTVFGGREFAGRIDEVALYNTTLSSQQIGAIYNARLTPAGNGAVAPEPGSLMLTLGALPVIGLVARRRATR